VRSAPTGGGFQQRFEYVVTGPAADVAAWPAARGAAGDHVAEQRTVGGNAYALVLTSAPTALPASLAGVPFRDLCAGDLDGSLTWLWARLDADHD
jgi:hypothetical protein